MVKIEKEIIEDEDLETLMKVVGSDMAHVTGIGCPYCRRDIDIKEIIEKALQTQKQKIIEKIEKQPNLTFIVGGEVIVNGIKLNNKNRDATLKEISKDIISRKGLLKTLGEKEQCK